MPEQVNTYIDPDKTVGNQAVTPVDQPPLAVDNAADMGAPTNNQMADTSGISGNGIMDTTNNMGDVERQSYDAYNVGSVNAENMNVDSNMLVRDQMTGLLDENSKYLQLARTGAQQQANSRGLLNTSIAAGAGENAAIRSALPIAQQDAGTYLTVGRDNMAANNQMTLAEYQAQTNATRDAALAGYGDQSALYQNQLAAERDRMNAGYQGERDARLQEYQKENLSLEQRNQLERMATEQGYNLETLNQQQINELVRMDQQQTYTLARDSILQNFDLARLDQQQQYTVANAAQEFAYQMEQNRFQMASQFTQQFMDSSAQLVANWSAEVQAIYNNPNMTPAQQANAVASATQRHQTMMQRNAALYGDMGAWNVVDDVFPTSGAGGSTGTPTTPIDPPTGGPDPYDPVLPGGGDIGDINTRIQDQDVINENIIRR